MATQHRNICQGSLIPLTLLIGLLIAFIKTSGNKRNDQKRNKMKRQETVKLNLELDSEYFPSCSATQ